MTLNSILPQMIFASTLFAIQIALTTPLFAQEPPIPEKIFLEWAEPEEVEYDLEIVDRYWAWKDFEKDPVGTPILRVAVVFHDLKNSTKVKRVFGLTSRVSNFSIDLATLRPEKATLLGSYKEYHEEGDSIDVIFRVELDKPYVWVSLSCLDLGFSVDAYNKSGKHLFAGLKCQQLSPDVVSVSTIKSKDGRYAKIQMDDSPYSRNINNGEHWRNYQVAVSRVPEGRHLLGTFRIISDKKGASQVGYKVYYNPDAPKYSRYSANLSLGLVNNDYSETPSLAAQSQWSLFVQADFFYHAIPGTLDIDLSVGGDFLPFSQGNENFNNAKFLRVRSALGYWLPFMRKRNFSGRFALGTYLWRIDADEAQYGTGTAFGPYAEFRSDFRIGGLRPMSAFVRFIPLSFQLSNKEYHFGVEYRLKRFHPRIKWAALLEIRTATFSKELDTTPVPTTISHELFSFQFGMKIGF